MPQTRQGNIIKQTSLTTLEKEIIQGCLLGDGTLSKSGMQYRLRIEHASKYREYVIWKYSFLKRLCISDISYVEQHDSYRFGTVGHPEMVEMRHEWYHPKKHIPRKLVLTPCMIAIWFMDDGTKHRDTVDFSVHSFSDDDHLLLREQLDSRSIETTVNSDAKGKRLYVLKRSYPNFERLVKPYIIECMAHKLP